MSLKPDTICRIVNSPHNNNRIVRTISFEEMEGEWLCKALQTIHGVQRHYFIGHLLDEKPTVFPPGAEIEIPPECLVPLYDGDQDEAWVVAGRRVPTTV